MKRYIKANIDEVFVWDGVSDVPKNVVNVRIADDVTSIEERAFSFCRSLTSVTIPDGVTSIGTGAFYSCWNLTSITIPDSVTSIGWGAFWGCRSLKSITIPDSVTSIGEEAFNHCTSLTSVNIPDSVTSIGINAFSGCHKLSDVNITGFSEREISLIFNGTPFKRRLVSTQPREKSIHKFTQMRQAVLNGEIDNLVYDSKYSNYIYSLYSAAIDELEMYYPELFVESVIPGDIGSVVATYVKDGVTYKTDWDYEDECEFIEDSIQMYSTPIAVVEAIAEFVDSRLKDAEPDDRIVSM